MHNVISHGFIALPTVHCISHQSNSMALQTEIEKYRVENVTAEDVRHKNLSQLEQRLTETREQADWYQHKHDAAVKRVDQLKVGTRTVTHITLLAF